MFRFPATTTDGETVEIVEKTHGSGDAAREEQVLLSADGRKFRPVAGMKVEEILDEPADDGAEAFEGTLGDGLDDEDEQEPKLELEPEAAEAEADEKQEEEPAGDAEPEGEEPAAA